jgi:peptidyl-prolyl cis-trans isomerase C
VTKRLIVSTLVFATVVSLGCRKAGQSQAQSATGTSSPSQQAASSPAGGPAAPGTAPRVKPVPAQHPEIVARVNGEDIKRDELDMAIQTLQARAGTPVPPEQRDAVYRQVLDRIIGYHLLVQEAHNRKATAAPWQVDAQVDQIKKQFPNETAFNEMLKSRGVTLERLRQETADTLAVNSMLEQEVEPKVQVKDADIKTFYGENKARFRQEDAVHASHILIRVDPNADASTKAKARAEIDGVLKQIRRGADFAALAKKHSQDPGSAANGGDLGFFTRGQMVPTFEAAAFALKPGQTSNIVETQFGYHIIKVTEAKPGRDLGFDEVKDQISEYLRQQRRDQEGQAFVDRLKAKAKIDIRI